MAGPSWSPPGQSGKAFFGSNLGIRARALKVVHLINLLARDHRAFIAFLCCAVICITILKIL